jgi:hypothetical protein
MRTVLSYEALARRSLSGPNEVTLVTAPSCASSVFKHAPPLALQMRTVSSNVPLARRPPPSEQTLIDELLSLIIFTGTASLGATAPGSGGTEPDISTYSVFKSPPLKMPLNCVQHPHNAQSKRNL